VVSKVFKIQTQTRWKKTSLESQPDLNKTEKNMSFVSYEIFSNALAQLMITMNDFTLEL
jgi:hypothetical protein